MSPKSRRVVFSACLAGCIGLALVWFVRAPESNVTLAFQAKVDGKPFVLNDYAYANPGGAGQFQIRNFRFYLSNFTLSGPQGDYIVPDSYHLARFDNAQQTYTLSLPKVPLSELSKLSFSIGVDAVANTSIESRGDLDPNSRMAWNWEVGYKFVVLEGSLKTADRVQPLVYHVGFSENRRKFTFDFAEPEDLSSGKPVTFEVDVMDLFRGAHEVDMTQMPSVKFDKGDAGNLADNYQKLISLSPRS